MLRTLIGVLVCVALTVSATDAQASNDIFQAFLV